MGVRVRAGYGRTSRSYLLSAGHRSRRLGPSRRSRTSRNSTTESSTKVQRRLGSGLSRPISATVCFTLGHLTQRAQYLQGTAQSQLFAVRWFQKARLGSVNDSLVCRGNTLG